MQPQVGAPQPSETVARKSLLGFSTPRRRPRTLRQSQRGVGLLFISPAMFLFAVFVVLPAITALYLSFTEYDILRPARWVGLANYERLLSDSLFHRGLRNVTLYTAIYVPCMVAAALMLALALNRKRPGVVVFRGIYYLPVVTSPVAASTVWMWLLNKNFGVVNQVLGYVGINGPAWLSNSNTALYAIVLVTLWQGIGGSMIIYLAGLQGVPSDLVEAARLDGASTFQVFRDVTWPMLRTTTLFVVTVSLIGAFQLFDQAYVMTQGGPGYATLTPVYHIYSTGFERLQMGYASSQALIMFIIILAVTIIQLRINREDVFV